MKILVTSGATEEPIDGVRYITNFSTGKTGAIIADRLSSLGVQVTYLHGSKAEQAEQAIEKHCFTSFRSLDKKLKELLSSEDYDGIIHLAAVSDYSVEYIETENGQKIIANDKGKISSDNEALILHLKKNFKILPRLKEYSRTKEALFVIGFKLTDTDSAEEMQDAVGKLLAGAFVDLVVHNKLRDITATSHPAMLYDADGKLVCHTETKEELADKLYQILKDKGC
jgi:phosphopantothenoylcysteine decarboxylase/phosphopantothenate--cysteine ligase